MRQIINAVYAHLVEDLEGDALKEFDRDLATDPQLVAQFGRRSRGANNLMAMMGGGKRPAAPASAEGGSRP